MEDTKIDIQQLEHLYELCIKENVNPELIKGLCKVKHLIDIDVRTYNFLIGIIEKI